MKQLTIAAFIVVIAFGCNNNNAAENTPATPTADTTTTTTAANNGFTPLFNGKDFTGWHTFKKDTVSSAWKIVDGAICLDTSKKKGWQVIDGGDIVTNEEFENYHLKLEWKIAPNGNSGIIFNVQEDGDKFEHTFHTGPEMQVMDHTMHGDGDIKKHQVGDLYDLIASTNLVTKPAGEWNQAEIILNNGKLELMLNGVTTVSTTLWDDNWKKLVAGSKFKEWPTFGTFKKGHIALQDHGNAVCYRNIMIKKL